MSATAAHHETSIFERLLVSPESAEAMLTLKFPPADESRMRDLVEKNNKGTISDAEKEEMEAYCRIGNFLGILQSKARQSLKRPSDSHPATA